MAKETLAHHLSSASVYLHAFSAFISLFFIFFYFFLCHDVFSDPWYLEVGESIVNSLNSYTKVDGGFASIRDVTTMQLEDHQHSFFLAET